MYHRQSWRKKIRGIINLDTVGYTSDLKNSQIYPDGIPVKVLKLISKPVIRHIPIPGIFISDSANFRYPHYHTPSDLIYYVNFDFLEKITHVSLLTLIDMAEIDGGRQQKQF